MQGKGLRLVLDLPVACFLPEHEPYISAIARHILEDPATLQAAMEAEIRNTLANGGRPPKANPYAAGASGLLVMGKRLDFDLCWLQSCGADKSQAQSTGAGDVPSALGTPPQCSS